ncbi:hypothetical protein GCM10010174_79260 [Kutzneria viridogrisea]|uniref:MmpS family membrane protein n=1 Tax=Kutzneria viridogrisea TaxID=47990 RepID=A0ABR6BC92_9PSEU|nr:hypothetical protein [Kutzneria viridogrisea]
MSGPFHYEPSPAEAPPQPTPQQRRTVRWIVLSLGGLFVVLLAAVVATNRPPANQAPAVPATSVPAAVPAPLQVETTREARPVSRHVVYEVTGTATGASTITYNSDGETSIQQETGATVPWKHELDVPSTQRLTILQVSAQNAGGGTITCTISVGGRVVKTGTSTGQYAIASCNAPVSGP